MTYLYDVLVFFPDRTDADEDECKLRYLLSVIRTKSFAL